jgi:hypothetical protein
MALVLCLRYTMVYVVVVGQFRDLHQPRSKAVNTGLPWRHYVGENSPPAVGEESPTSKVTALPAG